MASKETEVQYYAQRIGLFFKICARFQQFYFDFVSFGNCYFKDSPTSVLISLGQLLSLSLT